MSGVPKLYGCMVWELQPDTAQPCSRCAWRGIHLKTIGRGKTPCTTAQLGTLTLMLAMPRERDLASLRQPVPTPPHCSPTKPLAPKVTPVVSGTTASDFHSAEAGTVYEEAAQQKAAESDAPFMEALLSTSLEHPHIVRPAAT